MQCGARTHARHASRYCRYVLRPPQLPWYCWRLADAVALVLFRRVLPDVIVSAFHHIYFQAEPPPPTSSILHSRVLVHVLPDVMVCTACYKELLPAAAYGTEEASAVAEGDMCMWCADTNQDDDKLLCDVCPKVRSTST